MRNKKYRMTNDQSQSVSVNSFQLTVQQLKTNNQSDIKIINE